MAHVNAGEIEYLIDYGKGKNIQQMFKVHTFEEMIKLVNECPPDQQVRVLIIESKDGMTLNRVSIKSEGYHAVYYD